MLYGLTISFILLFNLANREKNSVVMETAKYRSVIEKNRNDGFQFSYTCKLTHK